jgi:hypothetical protein
MQSLGHRLRSLHLDFCIDDLFKFYDLLRFEFYFRKIQRKFGFIWTEANPFEEKAPPKRQIKTDWSKSETSKLTLLARKNNETELSN